MKSFKKNLTLFFMIVSMVQICAMDTQEPQVPTLHVVLNIERVAKERQARWQRNKNLTDLVMNSDWCKNNVLDMLGGYVGHAQCKKPYYFVSVNRKVAPWILINKQENAIVQAVKFNNYERLKKACGLLDAYTSLCISPQASKSSEFIKNYKNKDGLSLLHCWDSLELTQFLLDRGVNIDTQDKNGWTSLHFNVVRGNLGIAKLLLDRGANIDIQDARGRTPLHRSARFRNLGIAKLLLDRGASIDIQDVNGHTPLSLNSLYDNVGGAKILLDRGASIDIQDANGHTPLLLNLLYDNIGRGAKILLDHGANVNIKDNNGDSLLHRSAWRRNVAAIKLLLEYGADTEIKDNQGRTPDQATSNQEIKDLIAQARIDRAQQIIAEDNIVNETASCCTIS